MVLCPEVLTLIVAAALLSRPGRAQRESKPEQQGRLVLTAEHSKEQGHPLLPCCCLTIGLGFLPSGLLESKEKSHV